MKLGLLQLHITADIADNKTRLAEGIIDLAKRGAELIVLQELHNSLYFCQVEDVENFNLAEPIRGIYRILRQTGEGSGRGNRYIALRAPCAGSLSQHGGGD